MDALDRIGARSNQLIWWLYRKLTRHYCELPQIPRFNSNSKYGLEYKLKPFGVDLEKVVRWLYSILRRWLWVKYAVQPVFPVGIIVQHYQGGDGSMCGFALLGNASCRIVIMR